MSELYVGSLSMTKASIYSILICGLLFGCGGGEDFSAPPKQIAQQLAKNKKSSEPDSSSQAEVAAQKAPSAEEDMPKSAGSEAAVADAGGASSEQVSSPVGSKTAESQPDTKDVSSGEGVSLLNQLNTENAAAKAEASSPGNAESQKPTAAETDSGKSMQDDAMAMAKSTRSQKNDGAGMSFLDSLSANSTPAKPSVASRARDSIARTGRFAVSLPKWLELKLAMSKRFFFATTPDATRIAASSGERSLGVLNTQIDDPARAINAASNARSMRANGRANAEVTVQSLPNLPAVVNAVELFDQGNVVLIGTEDGRLIARSCANLQDWDIYAQDLFAFQDEHRPATRISDSSVTVVRAIGGDRILTIDDSNMCRLWNAVDVVHSPIPPLQMTLQQVASPEASTRTATHVAEIKLPDSQVLNLVTSPDLVLCAVVTADNVITIFQTDDASVVATISAEDLDNTQPVSVWFESQVGRVLVGLADGRILRRALPGGASVSSTNEADAEVDYEIVFAPDLNDRSGAVTALAVTDDGAFLHFGRMDGMVGKFDLPRKQSVSSKRLHTRPVLEIRATTNGILSIGDDRVAQLVDIPASVTAVAIPGVNIARPKTEQKFDLPKDETLPTKVVAGSQVDGESEGFVRQRNVGRQNRLAVNEVSSIGVRPANSALALYEHQLRVATADKRDSIRQQILAMRENGVDATEASNASTSAVATKTGELTTSLDYSAKPLRVVAMALSDDGTTVAATQYYKQAASQGGGGQPVFVWDVPTSTVLRTWQRLPGVRAIDAVWKDQSLVPSPMKAVLNMQSGQLQTDQVIENITHAFSKDRTNLVVGRKGQLGQAIDAVAIHSMSQGAIATGLEAFEGFTAAVAYSHDGQSVFVSVREKTRVRLLELDGKTLAVISELATEPMSGAWDLNRIDRTAAVGTTHIIPSPSGKLLVTYGHYEKDYQLRIWKKSADSWPQDSVKVIPFRTPLIDVDSTTTSICFVNQQDNLLGIVGVEGIATIDLRSGTLKESLPVPDVDGRRPVVLLSNDGAYAFSGDGEGNVWMSEMRSLERRPKKFVAQAGAITGMAISPNGNFLATAGLENRIRVWDVTGLVASPAKTAKK